MSSIQYHSAIEGLEAGQLTGFFVGWPKPPAAETLLEILRASHARVLAVDESTGQVVGFINAVSDGILAAYIPLLEVVPSHQGGGIGSELVRRLLDQLSDLYMVDVCCDLDLVPFYERFGLIAVSGMVRRNMEQQSGRA